ncbi:MAG: T9SS type A sorting domain-containing protein [Bacteroidia bacterium]|nr:T9SS type A sorting domain-containing protein [Bacteroidia bacterium]
MKKILLTMVSVIAITGLSFAQTRTIDWSTESILYPDSLKSTPSSGTPFNVEVVMKNNGTSSAMAGDSIWFQFAVSIISNSQTIVLYPGPNSNTFAIKTVTRTIATGDTMHLALNLTANLKFLQSTNVRFAFIAHCLNRPGLGFETGSGLTNNQKTKDIVWFNEHGWYVGIDGALANTTKVYPNPVKDVLNIDVNYDLPKVLNIFDIAGRKVEEVLFDEKNTTVNVSNYTRGFYFYEIKTSEGEVIKSGKILVN